MIHAIKGICKYGGKIIHVPKTISMMCFLRLMQRPPSDLSNDSYYETLLERR